MSLFRKPNSVKQGLKILGYGTDGSGKSIYGLSFPEVVILDAEAKMGVYENNPKYNKNMLGLLNTQEYEKLLQALGEVSGGKTCKTFMTDSMTYLYSGMQVSSMEHEEKKAEEAGKDKEDVIVAQRGWGKIKLNVCRLRGHKAQGSSRGINLYDTAHEKDIMQKVGKENVKIGEEPDIAKNSKHEYDVILHFKKEKNIATGQMEYFAIVDKDTTNTFKVGDRINNPTYDNTFKTYIESMANNQIVETNYDKAIENNMKEEEERPIKFGELVKSFTAKFKDLVEKDKANQEKVLSLLKENGVTSYKDIACYDGLLKVVETIDSWK